MSIVLTSNGSTTVGVQSARSAPLLALRAASRLRACPAIVAK